MNTEQDRFPEREPDEWQADAQCELCGRFGALRMADRLLCPDCCANSGSCCPEFGAFDAATAALNAATDAGELPVREPSRDPECEAEPGAQSRASDVSPA